MANTRMADGRECWRRRGIAPTDRIGKGQAPGEMNKEDNDLTWRNGAARERYQGGGAQQGTMSRTIVVTILCAWCADVVASKTGPYQTDDSWGLELLSSAPTVDGAGPVLRCNFSFRDRVGGPYSICRGRLQPRAEVLTVGQWLPYWIP